MINLILDEASVTFTIYNSRSRGLINSLVDSVIPKLFNTGRTGSHDRMFVQTNDVPALKSVSVKLSPGDSLGVLGSNGSGKTTFLRTLHGVFEPTSGSRHSSGKIASLIDITAGIEPDLTGYENIYLYAKLSQLSRVEQTELITDVTSFSGLGDALNRPVRTYSQGMLLRLAFALTTHIRPDILLMDEMISVGDHDFILKSAIRLKEFMEQAGILVLASHSPDVLKTYCKKGIVFAAGDVVYSGHIQDCINFHFGGL